MDKKKSTSKKEKHTNGAFLDEESHFHIRLRELIGNESVAGFARQCEFSESLIRDYLNAKRFPGMKKISAISRATGVTTDWLITGRGPKYRQPENAETTAISNPRIRNLAILLEALTEDQREAILADAFSRAETAKRLKEMEQALTQLTKKAG